jgi:hypothetical protein
MIPREPCGHVWGPWETVYEGTLGGDDRRATGDRVRLCELPAGHLDFDVSEADPRVRCWASEAEWADPLQEQEEKT